MEPEWDDLNPRADINLENEQRKNNNSVSFAQKIIIIQFLHLTSTINNRDTWYSCHVKSLLSETGVFVLRACVVTVLFFCWQKHGHLATPQVSSFFLQQQKPIQCP